MSKLKLLMSHLIGHVRSILAIKALEFAYDIAPADEKEIYLEGTHQILVELYREALIPKEDASNRLYCPVRFWNICIELGLDPYKVVESENRAVIAIAVAFARKEIDEVELMRSLQNLSILNGEKWKAN